MNKHKTKNTIVSALMYRMPVIQDHVTWILKSDELFKGNDICSQRKWKDGFCGGAQHKLCTCLANKMHMLN